MSVKPLIDTNPPGRGQSFLLPHAVHLPQITVNILPSCPERVWQPSVIICEIQPVIISREIAFAQPVQMPLGIFEIKAILFGQAPLPFLPPLPRGALPHNNVNFPIVRSRSPAAVYYFLSYHFPNLPCSLFLKIILYTSPKTSKPAVIYLSMVSSAADRAL